MTIEIQELIIQARVTDSARGARQGASLEPLGRMGQNHLVEQVTQQVLERLRDEREQR
ncbi:hypothetical protein KBJ94_29190 [Pseudomonas sp. ITA]|uniref:DUF5908 family protein n=1 Tax=Pseudomonas sp. ITA TaxID=2825841 RepID=UPI002498F41D|nr:DUF5908 family protein [Pseudomonas sp. ITA]MDI2146125.1 hypothetical protein [Pseudomonas sp. ITA]